MTALDGPPILFVADAVERAVIEPLGETFDHECGVEVLSVETKLRSTGRGEYGVLINVPAGTRHRCADQAGVRR